jgi:hypothetical protein
MTPDSPNANPALAALASLRRFARRPAPRERCDLCAAEIAAEHAHLLEVAARRLVCACDPCAILFSGQGSGKYHRVPRTLQYLPDFRLDDAAWAALELPINLAFFVSGTPAGRVVARYPSPGGATESLVAPDAWQALVEDNPVLARFEPDVEALLVNRLGEARACYRAGIDECYRLVGLIRTHWKGMSGGPALWDEVGKFFARLEVRSGHGGGTAHA